MAHYNFIYGKCVTVKSNVGREFNEDGNLSDVWNSRKTTRRRLLDVFRDRRPQASQPLIRYYVTDMMRRCDEARG